MKNFAILVCAFILTGFGCEKSKYLVYEVQNASCSDLSLESGETSTYEIAIKDDPYVCEGSKFYQYGYKEDVVRGFIVNRTSSGKCTPYILVATIPEFAKPRSPIDYQKQARLVADAICFKDIALKQLYEEPKKPEDLAKLCSEKHP